MSRRTFLRTCLGAACVSGCPSIVKAQAQLSSSLPPLRMAVHPYNSTLALITAHRPLQQYLEKALQRPIEFYTAASFEAFIGALMAGEYDIVISPPHFAVVAVENGDYAPLVHYQTKLEPLLVVRQDSSFSKPADFVGKRIAMADKSAFIRIVVIKWLADAGLVAGKHYQILERPTHSASISATAMGEADAGLATLTALKQVPADVQQKMRTVTTGLKFPHLFTLAHRRLGEPMITRLKKALTELTSDHPEGKAFFERTGFVGYEDITADELAAIKPYLGLTRQLMDSTR